MQPRVFLPKISSAADDCSKLYGLTKPKKQVEPKSQLFGQVSFSHSLTKPNTYRPQVTKVSAGGWVVKNEPREAPVPKPRTINLPLYNQPKIEPQALDLHYHGNTTIHTKYAMFADHPPSISLKQEEADKQIQAALQQQLQQQKQEMVNKRKEAMLRQREVQQKELLKAQNPHAHPEGENMSQLERWKQQQDARRPHKKDFCEDPAQLDAFSFSQVDRCVLDVKNRYSELRLAPDFHRMICHFANKDAHIEIPFPLGCSITSPPPSSLEYTKIPATPSSCSKGEPAMTHMVRVMLPSDADKEGHLSNRMQFVLLKGLGGTLSCPGGQWQKEIDKGSPNQLAALKRTVPQPPNLIHSNPLE
eukprot:NODE_787_length_1348_cov_141.293303_g575_i0.p1 GENE.NODE_787_length_1348_cov_141.293303_g575_i0~~NODE_787_length_1348_cov_141.293303_g575_i0.p1  ORF type:complete len:377 (+),score=75.50 NODE_787_length_1348_cov_141.293303_g575_i0:54-1133(+)